MCTYRGVVARVNTVVLLLCRAALAQGYRQIDCASFYGNETTIGKGLADFIKEEGREQLFITSKVWNDAHRPHLVRCCFSCGVRVHALRVQCQTHISTIQLWLHLTELQITHMYLQVTQVRCTGISSAAQLPSGEAICNHCVYCHVGSHARRPSRISTAST